MKSAEKQRLSTVTNYDDTEIKADIAKCATKDVATTTSDGLMSKEDKGKLDELENYSLPIASVDTLGGIKIGDGLSVTDGVLSAVTGGSLKIDTFLPWKQYSKSEYTISPPSGIALSDYFGFVINVRITVGSTTAGFTFFVLKECIEPAKEGEVGGNIYYACISTSGSSSSLGFKFGKVYSNSTSISYSLELSCRTQIIGLRLK